MIFINRKSKKKVKGWKGEEGKGREGKERKGKEGEGRKGRKRHTGLGVD